MAIGHVGMFTIIVLVMVPAAVGMIVTVIWRKTAVGERPHAECDDGPVAV